MLSPGRCLDTRVSAASPAWAVVRLLPCLPADIVSNVRREVRQLQEELGSSHS